MLDIMWLFTVPVLKIAMKCGVGISTVFLIIQVIRWYFQSKPPNPFAKVNSISMSMKFQFPRINFNFPYFKVPVGRSFREVGGTWGTSL